jgi:CHAT domain-containing protein
LGANHPKVARSLNHLAASNLAKGDAAQAIIFQSRANAISEHNIALNLSIGSERQKLAYLALFSAQTHQTLSLHVQSAPKDLQALRLAFTTLLQRKGRSFDAMTDTIAPLRRRASPQDQALFDKLSMARSRWAVLAIKGPDKENPAEYQAQLKQIEERVEKLESEIGARSMEVRVQGQPVTLAAVEAAIPPQTALVEFAFYFPFNAKTLKSGPPRYVAYVLAPQGEPRWVDLGEAAPIDRAVVALRQALRNPERDDVNKLARMLDEMVMRPVRALLGEANRVLISPDGALNLTPFAALVDEQGRYLVENYLFSYLTSGRDLLRLPGRSESKQESVIIADPDFGVPAGNVRRRAKRSSTAPALANAHFTRLAGTAEEALALKAMLPQASVLTGKQATEAALKRVDRPNILHIATHGFFLEDIETKPIDTRDVVLIGDGPAGLGGAQLENPLLRSGLALTGANLRMSSADQEDDGVLTAMEVAGLDLWGTKLVVLSACDTGVGEVKNGEGVYGLRRALVLAGSETQVMSLWSVSDEGTRDLMIEYYKALQRGEGRSEGLRQVQLQMLGSKNRRHPFYWASFIQSGEWANLEGKR